MYDTNMTSLGENLRRYRKIANMSMQQLGDAIGKSKASINRYETGEVLLDMLTAIEICNIFNIDLNELCEVSVQGVERNINHNPFNGNLLYLYYISKNGVVVSSIEITEKQYSNYVLMKNGLVKGRYKQEYTGIMECNYNTAFICLTNAISNPGLDKFQVEIDLHSKWNNMYFGIFLGVSDNTHRPTARKCMLTKQKVNTKEELNEIFNILKVNQEEAQDIIHTKYWDMKSSNIKDYVICMEN